MGIYWPLEEQMLAAGGEVLLERLASCRKGVVWTERVEASCRVVEAGSCKVVSSGR